MTPNLNILRVPSRFTHAQMRSEICEHKGTGHPDSIFDGVAEAVSQALRSAYLRTYGEIRHHNVDKALLIGGQSRPRFRGANSEIVTDRFDRIDSRTEQLSRGDLRVF